MMFLAALAAILITGCTGHETARDTRSSGAAVSTPADSTSPSLAVAWIQSYYRAINERRYEDAYAHWEQEGKASGKTFQAFRDGFATTEKVEAFVGSPGPVGGAAGSRYIDVPVRIVAHQRDGTLQPYIGTYTLRLSVVDGATPEQRSWHIYSATIHRQSP